MKWIIDKENTKGYVYTEEINNEQDALKRYDELKEGNQFNLLLIKQDSIVENLLKKYKRKNKIK